MSREANTNYDIHPLLKKRWSPRAFSESRIEKDKLQRLFEAVRWTPSSSNEQPWAFIIGFKGDSTYNSIMSSMVEFNQIWSKFAPVLVAACARKDSIKDEGENSYCNFDLGQSIAYLTFQAASEGLFVHQIGGFNPKQINEVFKIPNNYEAIAILAIGYIGDPKILHPKLEKLEYTERKRNPLNEFIFSSEFGKDSGLFK